MATSSEWANGIAPLLEPVTQEETEIIVSISDLHVPFHDPSLVDSAINLIRRLKPHRVILNGDVEDFFQLSRFNTSHERMDLLQWEIDVANRIRERIRRAAPNAQLIENEGNHDSRLITYVTQNAKALSSLRALEPRQLLDWDRLEFLNFGGHGFRLRPNFLVKHGSMIRGEAGATAKAELGAAGISGISGHTHRLSTYRKSGYESLQWTEQGCLCLLEPDYVVGPPNWTHGLVVGQFSTSSSAFLVEEVQAKNGKFIYGGKQY